MASGNLLLPALIVARQHIGRMDIGKRLLDKGRFVRSGTASWESRSNLALSEAVDAVRWALEVVEVSDPHALDHIWIYIDSGPVETGSLG